MHGTYTDKGCDVQRSDQTKPEHPRTVKVLEGFPFNERLGGEIAEPHEKPGLQHLRLPRMSLEDPVVRLEPRRQALHVPANEVNEQTTL